MITPALSLLLLLAGQTVNDDRDVIQTALLSFFHKEDWHAGDWTPKSHVVLGTQLRSKVRPNFQEEFNSIRERCAKDMEYATIELKRSTTMKLDCKSRLEKVIADSKRDLAALEVVKYQLSEGAAYVPPPLVPLKSMAWDSKIILTDKSNRFKFDDRNADRSLEKWTVYAYAFRPTYSPNGRYAIVEFRIPWSIHSAEVRFLFARKHGTWTRIMVSSIFHV